MLEGLLFLLLSIYLFISLFVYYSPLLVLSHCPKDNIVEQSSSRSGALFLIKSLFLSRRQSLRLVAGREISVFD